MLDAMLEITFDKVSLDHIPNPAPTSSPNPNLTLTPTLT